MQKPALIGYIMLHIPSLKGGTCCKKGWTATSHSCSIRRSNSTNVYALILSSSPLPCCQGLILYAILLPCYVCHHCCLLGRDSHFFLDAYHSCNEKDINNIQEVRFSLKECNPSLVTVSVLFLCFICGTHSVVKRKWLIQFPRAGVFKLYG